MPLEGVLKAIAERVALAVELVAVLMVALGAGHALYGLYQAVTKPGAGYRRKVWRDFATWIMLALEFMLGADIVRTAISPSWFQTAQLAAIAAIRTFLNFFLERDLESAASRGQA